MRCTRIQARRRYRSWSLLPRRSPPKTVTSSTDTFRRSWKRPTSTEVGSPSKSGAPCRVGRWWSEMTKVLVVEDNPANMTLSTFLLESAGHSVLKATDAETGVALARAEHPDLILMDIQLPGMDGLCATALLKGDAATKNIPVVALTALAMKGDEERI